MSWRGRKRRFVAALALAAALVIPAAPAQATESGEPGEQVQVWGWLWEWVSAVLTVEPPAGLEADCDHGSHIDPNG
jgi:hypothetical protein